MMDARLLLQVDLVVALLALMQILQALEYRPQRWDLRDVLVSDVGAGEDDGVLFPTSLVTCVVETWVETLPRQPSPLRRSLLRELSAFAVDRRRHTFKGAVEVHDADTRSALVNETHRLVTRGRRRCLPGPEARAALDAFLRETRDQDRILVVRLLDDQRGRDFPRALGPFAKLFQRDTQGSDDDDDGDGDGDGQDLSPEWTPWRPEAADRVSSQRRPHQPWFRPTPPPPLLDAPPVLWGRRLTIGKPNNPNNKGNQDKNADLMSGPDGYGTGARRLRTPPCDAAHEGEEREEPQQRLGDADVVETPKDGARADNSTEQAAQEARSGDDLKDTEGLPEAAERRNPDADLSPFPVEPPPQPDRGMNLPIKVPPKDIAQWPSHLSRAANVTRRRQRPLYYPDFIWPVPFTKRAGTVLSPPGAAAASSSSMYPWGPEARIYPQDESKGDEDDAAPAAAV